MLITSLISIITVIIPAGGKSGSLNVPISDNDRVDETKTICFAINGTSLPDVVVPGDPDQSCLNIIDNDSRFYVVLY